MNESNGTISVPHLEDLGQSVNVVNIDQDAVTPGLSVVPSAAFAAQGDHNYNEFTGIPRNTIQHALTLRR